MYECGVEVEAQQKAGQECEFFSGELDLLLLPFEHMMSEEEAEINAC